MDQKKKQARTLCIYLIVYNFFPRRPFIKDKARLNESITV